MSEHAMTPEGLDALREEIERLEGTGRSEIAKQIKTAREWGDLKEAPSITPTTRRIRTGAPARLGFSLDKVSRVGMTVMHGGHTVFATSATVGRGQHFFRWSSPAAPGMYSFTVRATDLAGNRSDPETVSLRILKR